METKKKCKLYAFRKKWCTSKERDASLSGLEHLLQEFLDLCMSENWVIENQWVTLMRAAGLMPPLLEGLDPATIKLHLVKSAFQL